MWQHFAFVDADMVPIGSAISDSLTAKDETQPPVLNIILPGYQQKVVPRFLCIFIIRWENHFLICQGAFHFHVLIPCMKFVDTAFLGPFLVFFSLI